MDSEQESEDDMRKQEDKESGAKPKKSLSNEEKKAQQDAAKAELPYTFTGKYSHSKNVFKHRRYNEILGYFKVSFVHLKYPL